MLNATASPPWMASGGYSVQPPAMAPPPVPNSRYCTSGHSSRVNANGRIQNDQLFMRGSAMSGAPIISGTIQLARPTKAGMIAPKIITSACSVVIWLKKYGCTNCRPGCASSVRITPENSAPTQAMMKANTRYSVPMSLWLVEHTQRLKKPCGLSSWCASEWATCVVMIDLGCECRGLRLAGAGGGRRGGGGRIGAGGRGFLFVQPLLEFGHRHGLDHDRHEAVVLAAQLGALAAIDAGIVDHRPGVVDDAGNGVLLDAERRHPPGVDDVVAGDDEADLGVGRHHQRMIDVEQIRRLAVVLDLPRIEPGAELAGHVAHDPGRRIGEADQDQDRHHGPDDLDLGVVAPGRGDRALGLAEADHGDDHRAEHD